MPSLRRFWPIFPLLGGVASSADYFFGSKRPGSLGKGVVGIGLAILFCGFTYGWLPWRRVADWAPAIPAVVGAGLFATWLAGRRTPGFLISGVVGMVLGLSGFALRFERLREMLPPPALIWGVLILLLGSYLLWRAFGGKRRAKEE